MSVCVNTMCFISVSRFKMRQMVDVGVIHKQTNNNGSAYSGRRKCLHRHFCVYCTRHVHSPPLNPHPRCLPPDSGQTICSLVCLPNLTPGNFIKFFLYIFSNFFRFFLCFSFCFLVAHFRAARHFHFSHFSLAFAAAFFIILKAFSLQRK